MDSNTEEQKNASIVGPDGELLHPDENLSYPDEPDEVVDGWRSRFYDNPYYDDVPQRPWYLRHWLSLSVIGVVMLGAGVLIGNGGLAGQSLGPTPTFDPSPTFTLTEVPDFMLTEVAVLTEMATLLIDCEMLIRQGNRLSVSNSLDFQGTRYGWVNGVFLTDEETGSRCQVGLPGERVNFYVPYLSPDQSHLFVIIADPVWNLSELIVSRVDGSMARVVAPANYFGSTGQPWSYDGEHMLFLSSYSGYESYFNNLLSVVNATGTHYQLVAQFEEESIVRSVWSPVSKEIAVITEAYQNYFTRSTMYIVDIEEGDITPITILDWQHGYYVSYLNWSPDGSQLLFVYEQISNSRSTLYTMRRDDTDVQVVIRTSHIIHCAEWTPDMRHIVYLHNVSDDSEVWQVPVEGGEPQLLLDHPIRGTCIST